MMLTSPQPSLPPILLDVAGRWPILLTAAALGAAAAVGAHALRQEVHEARVELAVGSVADEAWVQPHQELVRRFDSLAQVASLAGVDLPDVRSVGIESEGITVDAEHNLVALAVRGPDASRVLELAKGAAERIVADHGERFARLETARAARMAELKGMEADLRASLTGRSPAEGTVVSSLTLKEDAERPLVQLAKDVTAFQAEAERPTTAPTRIIAGPDVMQVGPRPGRKASALVGALGGLFMAALILLARRGTLELE